jgi:hypothetical protein
MFILLEMISVADKRTHVLEQVLLPLLWRLDAAHLEDHICFQQQPSELFLSLELYTKLTIISKCEGKTRTNDANKQLLPYNLTSDIMTFIK